MDINQSDPGFVTTIDKKVVDKIYQYYLSVKNKSSHIRKDLAHYIVATDPEWKEDLKAEFDYLEKHTYPFDKPILTHWLKAYDETHSYCGLHQDFHSFPKAFENNGLLVTNSILLHKSDDLEGGEIVFAGDAMDVDHFNVPIEERPYDTRGLPHRLEIMEHKNIGDVIWWNGYTVHGIARVKKGERITLMITKSADMSDKFFKKERNG